MENAALYATSNQLQRRDASVVLAAHLPGMIWKEGERMLDIGSGSGDVTSTLLLPALPVQPSSMVGLDVSQQMVDYANDSYSSPQPGQTSLSFHKMDIGKQTRPRDVFPGGFHKVFSLYCLHWVRDLPRAVTNIYQLLVNQGEALLIFLASNPIFRMYRLVAAGSKWGAYMLDVEDFVPVYQDSTDPADQFRSLLTNTGFSIRKCEAVEFSFTFQNQNQLLSALRAVNPFLSRIPQERHREFLMDCFLTLSKIDTPTSQGTMEARYKLMVAHIRK